MWESEYQDMIDDLVDQGYTLEQATQIVESQHGARDVFISGRTDAIITPITESNEATARQVAERVSDGSRGRAIRTTTEALSDLVEAGTSIADLQTYINTELVPLWRSQYQDMIDDLVEQGYTLEQAAQIVSAEHGTADEFVAGLVSDVIDPIQTSRASSQAASSRRVDRFGIRQARFNLGGATSEADFNTLFTPLITAINTFYDNEEARIQALGLGIDETNQLLAENTQARNEELRQANNITNTFAEERIRTEERANEQRIRGEMRVQGILTDLGDDAVEANQRRLDQEAEAYQDHADRLMDIEMRRLQAQEDARREHFRTQEDVILATARDLFDEPIENVSQLSGQQLAQVFADTGFIEDIADLRRRERRGDADAAISDTRATEAAEQELTNSLLETDMELSETRNALLASAVINLEALVTESAFTQGARGDLLARLGQAGIETPDLQAVLSRISVPQQSGLIEGSGGSGEVQIVVQVQPQDVMLDGEKVGQVVGNTIVRQGQNRRNPLGQNVVRS